MITEEKIWDYIDGSLDESERQLIADAIEHDPTTSLLYHDYLSTNELLKTPLVEKPSATFADRVMAAIQPAPVYQPAAKISMMPVLMGALPFAAILVFVSLIYLSAGSAATSALQISSHFAVTVKLLFILADSILFILFLEKWLETRKRKAISRNHNATL